MKKINLFFCFLVYLIPMSFDIIANDTIEVEKDELIKRYIADLSNLQRFTYEVEATMSINANGSEFLYNGIQEEGKLDLPQQRYYVKNSFQNTIDKNLQQEPDIRGSECVQKKDFFLYGNIDNKNTVNRLESRMNPISKEWTYNLRFQYISFLVGYLQFSDGNYYIPNLIKEGNTSLTKLDDGYLLSSHTDNRELHLKFEMISPLKLTEIHIKRLGNIKAAEIYDVSLIISRNDENSVEYHLTQKIYGGKIDGINIAPKIATMEVKLNNIKKVSSFSDSDFTFSTPIKNGTEVFMQDVPQIEYVWMDGEIVPKTDEVALAIARGGHKFIPGPQEPRFWLIALGIIMMLLGGGLKLRDMLKES
jgi:hypothetical protein